MEVHPYSFLVVWIFVRSLGVICYNQLVLYEFRKKILQGLVSHELVAFLSIFNLFELDELRPCYEKYLNQVILNSITLRLSFTNIPGLRSNFVDCESFLEPNSPDILTVCKTNLDVQLILAISL